ncbi:MAG: hypothetical protein IKY22_00760 [Bacteroidales bacterium]|nr:hypothetical protein [Bacteroidales bacterium]
MNITRENTGELELLIKVEISESDYQENVEKQLKEYQKKAVVAGFRRGNAPMGLIKKMYQKAIVADEVQSVIGQSLYKYIEDENLKIVGSPLSNDEKTGEIDFDKKDFVFYFDAALMPKANIQWKNIDVKRTQIKVSSKEIDEQLDDAARRFGKFETPETVEQTDFVYGKVVEMENGNVKEGGLNTFMSLEMKKLKATNFKKLFAEKKVEDKVVFNPSKVLDAETIAASFRMKEEEAQNFVSDVELSISGISRITPHEINEELFAKMFPNEDIKNVDDVKKKMKAETEKVYEEQCKMLFNAEVRKALIDQFTEYIPTEFIQKWLASRGEKDMTLENIVAEWDEKYLPSIKWEFIESSLREMKDIDPTQNEVVDYIKGVMTSYDLRKEDEDEKAYDERIEKAARTIAQDKNNVGQVYEKIYSEKLFALLEENIKPEVEKMTIKEFSERNK